MVAKHFVGGPYEKRNRAQDKNKNNETHANNNETTEQSLQCGQPKAQNHRAPALFFLKSLWAQWEQLLGLRLLGLFNVEATQGDPSKPSALGSEGVQNQTVTPRLRGAAYASQR